MFNNEILRLFPRKQVKAMDGMAVTAEVWEEAHEFHRQQLRLHALLQHGAGIVAGLTVIASEPADSSVYILPGIALDDVGRTIVLPEPRAYDLGVTEGTLYLIVSYSESRPQVSNGRALEDGPRYVHMQYTLEAVAELPSTPYVELARVRRREGNGAIRTARAPEQPQKDEIDLRFRREVGATPVPAASAAVVRLPGAAEVAHDEGVANLARSLRYSGSQPLWVDRNVPLGRELLNYDLVFLVGRDAFTLDSDAMNHLYNCLQANGTIFFESCRRGEGSETPGADSSFLELVESLGIRLESLEQGHELLRTPHIFGQPPDGYETVGSPKFRVGPGILFSTHDFGCIWRGDRRGRTAARSEIRSALEWGENIVRYAVARRLDAGGEESAVESGAGESGDLQSN